MKLLSTILILLIFSLIVNPNACTKAADSIEDSTMSCCKSSCDDITTKSNSEDEENDINKCDNPFMSCSHISFTTKTPLDLTYTEEINTIENNFYIQPVIQNSNNSIWRPPKLV